MKREEVLGSYFMNRIQDFLSAARTDLRLSLKDSDTIQIIPDPELGVAAIAVQGRWRYIEATITRDHPGGAKGTFTIWAVAKDNEVDNSPKPFTDHTDYAFDLRITKGEEAPSGSGVVIYEKIGELDWTGTEIEAVRQTHGSVTGAMIEPTALSSSSPSDITWTRAANGGLIAGLKTDSVGANEVANGSLTDAEIAAANKDGEAATASMRTLGTGAKQAAAGNDARLSDERVPKANSVNSSKIEDGSISLVDLAAAAKPLTWYTPEIIATEESRENAAFGTLATADEIKNVVLPEGGLIVLAYVAKAKNSVNGAGRAAIFLAANQLKNPRTATAQEIVFLSETAFGTLVTYQGGLEIAAGASAIPTTGAYLGVGGGVAGGGVCYIFAAAGTYDVSIQFKATSGSITVKERKLWVATMGF
jgi:hypothetical protein